MSGFFRVIAKDPSKQHLADVLENSLNLEREKTLKRLAKIYDIDHLLPAFLADDDGLGPQCEMTVKKK